ncbi:hypothetical protein GCM10011583_12080 [Streptomyces camponoticapitis]|uniref:Uncharacterized protein n=1 Tax=Streptomyces camponoticapitis TaxID=1616125 RepID=A0ABQ2E090_9ACTN|nr:hypothetical protein [Streptomyces camponoticapitis]GGJ82105.1 hypothetical protein GCM10011583_12080 [Streptomyces camponoticapitis]
MEWHAGMTITAERLMNRDLEEEVTVGAVAATGWSISSFEGRRKSGVTTVNLLVTRTGADVAQSAADSGNIAGDPAVCTLPVDWRPPATANGLFGNGVVDGEFSVNIAGVIIIRSISGNAGIVTGTNTRIFCTWL